MECTVIKSSQPAKQGITINIQHIHLPVIRVALYLIQVHHLLAGQGIAGVNYGPSICLCPLAHLEELRCLDEGLQCGRSSSCLQSTTPQPLLKQTHIIAEEEKKKQ